MDSFAELIRNIAKRGRQVVRGLPNTDPLSADSVTDIRNKKADKVLLDAAAKSEKAFNNALNSYFKKFGLKYKNGTLTSPSVDRAVAKAAKKVQSTRDNAAVMNALITALDNTNKSATGFSTTVPGTKLPNTDPLSTYSTTDIRSGDIRNTLGQ